MSNIVKIKDAHWFNQKKPWWRRAMDWVDGIWWEMWGWKPMYWFRCHTFTKYHIIDIRGADGYKWGYTDPAFRLWAACFKTLEDFIENEKPFDMIDYEGGGQGDIEKELRELYGWWKEGRAKEHEAHEKMLEGWHEDRKLWGGELWSRKAYEDPRWKAWSAERDRLDAKDDEMLMRLVKIRNHLWT